jgi:hypothetical protein
MALPNYIAAGTVAGLVRQHVQDYAGGEVDAVVRFQGSLAEGLRQRFKESYQWRKGAVLMLRFTTLDSRGAGGIGSVTSAGTIVVPVYGLEVFVVVRQTGKSDYDTDLALFDRLNDVVRFELFHPESIDMTTGTGPTGGGETIHRASRLQDAEAEEPGYLAQRHPFLLDVTRG